jgi:transcriptional regulator with XRE-family HTH domain
MQTAAAVGVSMTAVQQWENGGMRPGGENMAKLWGLIHSGDFETLGAEWDAWEAKRPG